MIFGKIGLFKSRGCFIHEVEGTSTKLKHDKVLPLKNGVGRKMVPVKPSFLGRFLKVILAVRLLVGKKTSWTNHSFHYRNITSWHRHDSKRDMHDWELVDLHSRSVLFLSGIIAIHSLNPYQSASRRKEDSSSVCVCGLFWTSWSCSDKWRRGDGVVLVLLAKELWLSPWNRGW